MTATASELEALVARLLDRARPDGGSADGRREGAGAVAAAISLPDGSEIRRLGGRTASFDADSSPLPADDPRAVPVTASTLFDMASVTKVATTLTAATLLEDGSLDLDMRVADLLSADAVPDSGIRVRHLLTHTAGLPPTMPLWRIEGTREERLAAIGRAPLIAAPGTRHEYSCIGFLLLGEILARLGGAPLPDLARTRVLIPAGASGATWWPDETQRARAAATEYQEDPPRGLVRGEVHDETAWSLGGVGNAGLFAGLGDALAIARILAGTAPGPHLSSAVRQELATDQLTAPASTGAPWRQGLGVRIGQELPDGRVLPGILGHPGFTGTALWADPERGTAAVLLTNRVHPRRDRFEVLAARREMARLAFAA